MRLSRGRIPGAAQRSLCDRDSSAINGKIKQLSAVREFDSSRLVRLQRSEELGVSQPVNVETFTQPGLRGADDLIQDHDARHDRIAREMAFERRVVCRDAERRRVPGLCVCSHDGQSAVSRIQRA